ncbi:MAG: UvrD-helicase domain-containing protein [Firmicutes bacterium]|nr:UvrD-helicase domain-containing protein [Bacillota bacterium]
MPWIADLHIHSHFSVATSKESNPRNLHRWAGLKGVSLVGTGDFTHPGWRQELRAELIPAEEGFYRLANPPAPEIPEQPEPRFVISGELSTIYKKNGRVRKVHHLIVLPTLEAADRISGRLEALGMNIHSDGRPILGLDSANLLELALEIAPEVIFIPAHIWTPHFSVFGSNSGFDRMEECYGDLTPHIFAVETGLSSDPGMNWRCSALDRYTLVSNSDAHNPQNLAREANLFEAGFSYTGMRDALRDKASGKFKGTVEFFPEEGKYHCDGHRNCNLAWDPEQTQAHGGICPVCNRKVTIGVWNRVVQLADRPQGFRPEAAPPYQNLAPLRAVIGSALGQGPASRKVEQEYFYLLHKLGPELTILREMDLEIIRRTAGPLVAEGIRKLRAGLVEIKPGYDGEYGVIQVLNEADRKALQGQTALFELARPASAKKEIRLRQSVAQIVTEARNSLGDELAAAKFSGLSDEQLRVIHTDQRFVIVSAGPGTGKTRTLVERIAYLINTEDVNPCEITGVTFTNKAAAELKTRIGALLHNEKKANKLNLGTFHNIAWRVLNQNPEPLGVKLLDEAEARDLIEEVTRRNRIPMTAREASLVISLMKNKYLWTPEVEIPGKVMELYQAYQQSLKDYQRLDFDDIMIKAVELWEEDPDWLAPYKKGFSHLFIDEFQDISLIQYKLVQCWIKNCRSLLVIGDPNQAIYGFRGASPRFFERLREDYPTAVYCQLTRNYRSAPVVVKAANALIGPAYRQEVPPRPPGSMGDSPPGHPVEHITWFETPSEKTASRAIVSEILSLLGGATMLAAHGAGAQGQAGRKRRKFHSGEGAYGFNDFAVLYRAGWQAESLEEALASEGLPYRVVGQTSTFEAASVKEFLAFFRYLQHPWDRFALRAALGYPRWGLSGAEIASVLQHLAQAPLPEPADLAAQWQSINELPELKHLNERLSEFYGVAHHYGRMLGRPNPEIIEDWMRRMNPGGQMGELEHFKRVSENYQGLEDMLRFLPLRVEADVCRKGKKTSGTEMITLSSIHASKGLEFPVVFITGVEEGLLPYGGDPDPDTVAEEQRLFYVGLTRAKERLYLVNSQSRLKRNENTPVEVSRFLKLIPEELLEKVDEQTQSKKQKQLELF